MIGIYGIFRKSDDKCMYVGQSKDVHNRIKHHLKGQTNTPFNNEEYYGDVIEEHMINDKNYRLEREKYWIKELNPDLNQIGKEGYTTWINGKHLSDDQKNKISIKRQGNHYPKLSESLHKLFTEHPERNGMYGKHQSDYCKIKNSEIHKDKPLSGEHRNKIGKSFKDRKWINNGVINKRVKPDELHQYLENGWKLGKIKTIK